jgi:hypothetical protein
MTNLAELKRFLAANINNPKILLSSKVYNQGKLIRENEPATIGHVQSNSFALNRNGNLSWFEYGKASELLINENSFKNKYITFEIHRID